MFRIFAHSSLYLLIIVITSGCKKESDPPTVNNDYIPMTAGSDWAYSSTLKGLYYLTSLNRDTILNGKSFHVFDHTNYLGVVKKTYFGKHNNIYWQHGDVGPFGTIGEMIVLMDSTINTNWTSILTFSSYTDHHKYTVTARDLQRNVNGKLFSNVIELNYEYSYTDPNNGNIFPGGGGKTYFAKGIGLIEQFWSRSQGFGITQDTVKIRNYLIK